MVDCSVGIRMISFVTLQASDGLMIKCFGNFSSKTGARTLVLYCASALNTTVSVEHSTLTCEERSATTPSAIQQHHHQQQNIKTKRTSPRKMDNILDIHRLYKHTNIMHTIQNYSLTQLDDYDGAIIKRLFTGKFRNRIT